MGQLGDLWVRYSGALCVGFLVESVGPKSPYCPLRVLSLLLPPLCSPSYPAASDSGLHEACVSLMHLQSPVGEITDQEVPTWP